MKPNYPFKLLKNYWREILSIGLLLLMLFLFYLMGKMLVYEWPVERAVEKSLSEWEETCSTSRLNETRGIAFVCYCPGSGFAWSDRCQHQYYIFIDKIDGQWVVDQSSKNQIW